MLVSSTTLGTAVTVATIPMWGRPVASLAGKKGSGEMGSEHTVAWRPVIRPHFPAVIRPHFPGHHVKTEQATFDGAVPHRHAARFFQSHLARQFQVGGEHPGGPASVIFLPVGGELAEEVAAVVGFR